MNEKVIDVDASGGIVPTEGETPKPGAMRVLDEGESMPMVQQKPMSQSDQFLSTIQQAASDPAVDMDKMERLYGMYEKVKSEEARVQYNAAMAIVQGKLPGIEATHLNTHTDSMYAKIGNILDAIRPVYTAEGFSISCYPQESKLDGYILVCCDVSHAGGDTRHFEYDSPIDDKGTGGNVNKTPTHGRASAMTYGERYLVGLIFALSIIYAGQDDDGNAAGTKPVEVITDEQVLTMEAKIKENDLDIEVFKGWLETHIGSRELKDIPVKSYPSCMKTLNRAIKKKSEAAQA